MTGKAMTMTSSVKRPHDDLYLDTVHRKKLDFDFEKVCSVTLSNTNVYGCLTCGCYFQGRGKSSPAYYHSLDEDHHLFINLNNNNLKVYALPESSLVDTPLLDDVRFALSPTYTKDDISSLGSTQSKDLNGNTYTPGLIGLNNIKNNTYSNVILHALCHCKLVRDRFLLCPMESQRDELIKRFTIFIRKLWSPRLFKNHISPHELLQYITVRSNKLFTINDAKDPKDFMIWLLNNLNNSMGSEKIISRSFQGKLKLSTTKSDDPATLVETYTKFWILTLDLPPVSMLRDGFGVQQIPQIRLETLLNKYNGLQEQVLPNGDSRRYSIERYPPYLIFHFDRFKDRHLGIDLSVKDRNQTLVEFPHELSFKDGEVKYKLLSNVVHELIQSDGLDEGDDKSNWKVQLHGKDQEWWELQDLQVKSKERELLFLGETYIQIWERVK